MSSSLDTLRRPDRVELHERRTLVRWVLAFLIPWPALAVAIQLRSGFHLEASLLGILPVACLAAFGAGPQRRMVADVALGRIDLELRWFGILLRSRKWEVDRLESIGIAIANPREVASTPQRLSPGTELALHLAGGVGAAIGMLDTLVRHVTDPIYVITIRTQAREIHPALRSRRYGDVAEGLGAILFLFPELSDSAGLDERA